MPVPVPCAQSAHAQYAWLVVVHFFFFFFASLLLVFFKRTFQSLHRKTKTQYLGQLNLESKDKKIFLEVIWTPIPK